MIARTIARKLPLGLRRPLRRLYKSWQLARPLNLEHFRPRKRYDGRSVVVAGLFRSATGLGRAAELVSRTLERRGTKVLRVDITARLGVPVLNQRADVKLPQDCGSIDATDVVIVLNPDNSYALSAFDRRWLLERCIIGHWIWELERVPRDWRRLAVSFDAIWAPTSFVADSIKAELPDFPGAIEVVSYAADSEPLPALSPQQRVSARERFGIARDAKVLGYLFSAGSNYERKNPEAAIDVFRKVFPHDRNAMLLLRCQDFDQYPQERVRLLAYIAGDQRVRLFERDNGIGLLEFYAAIDVLVSPSRAEGYGLTLVEAAQAGVSVVTSDWRLPSEIMAMPLVHSVGFDLVPVRDPQGHYSNIQGARWADPRVDEMAAVVRRLCAVPG